MFYRHDDAHRLSFGRMLHWETLVLAACLPGMLLMAGVIFQGSSSELSTPASIELPAGVVEPVTPVEPPSVDPGSAPRGRSPAAEASEPMFIDREASLADGTSPETAIGSALSRQLVNLLEAGRKTLEEARDFQAILLKQERLGGVLGEQEELRVKMRREPMSVYLRWETESGNELLWRVGLDDGKLLLHPGGWKGRLTPLLKIAPDHKLVKALTRRPIEKIGLWSLALELEKRRSALHRPGLSITTAHCTGPDGRECQSFQILDTERQEDDPDHVTVVFVDRLWKIAVGCEVYGWPEEGETEPPLLEAYFYSQIEFNVGLSDRDFDPANPAYGFAQAGRAQR